MANPTSDDRPLFGETGVVNAWNRTSPETWREADQWLDAQQTWRSPMQQALDMFRDDMRVRRETKDRYYLPNIPADQLELFRHSIAFLESSPSPGPQLSNLLRGVAELRRPTSPNPDERRKVYEAPIDVAEALQLLYGELKRGRRDAARAAKSNRRSLANEPRQRPADFIERAVGTLRPLLNDPSSLEKMQRSARVKWAHRVLRVAWVLTDTEELANASLQWLRDWEWGDFDPGDDEENVLYDDLFGPGGRRTSRLYLRLTVFDPERSAWERLTRECIHVIELARSMGAAVVPVTKQGVRVGELVGLLGVSNDTVNKYAKPLAWRLPPKVHAIMSTPLRSNAVFCSSSSILAPLPARSSGARSC
jgi:hypothetical protein